MTLLDWFLYESTEWWKHMWNQPEAAGIKCLWLLSCVLIEIWVHLQLYFCVSVFRSAIELSLVIFAESCLLQYISLLLKSECNTNVVLKILSVDI